MSNPWHGYYKDIEREEKRQSRVKYRQNRKAQQKRETEEERAFYKHLEEAITFHKSEAMRESNKKYETLHMQAVRNDTIAHAWEKMPVTKAEPIQTCAVREEFDALSLLTLSDQRKFEKWIRSR